MAKVNDGRCKAVGVGLLSGLCLLLGFGCWADEALEQPTATIWDTEPGQGFRRGTQTLTLEAGANYGFAAFGSVEAHHLALTSISYGWMLGDVMGKGHWYQGNWEFRAELFGGAEFSPDQEWVIGLTPHLRYNLMVSPRWVLFVDGGTGVTATGIGPPDLSNTFEFNLQGGGGAHWFIRDNLALTAEVKFFHMSCAGISKPNLGLNGVMGMIGITRFF